MLIDLHAHSKGISRCCQIDGKDMVLVTKNAGMDGVILTNHYDKNYLVDENDVDNFAKRYVDEYYYVKEEGKKIGFKVFFGIEVTMAKHNNIHMLVYGVDPSFVLKYPDLYDYTHQELYELVHKHNGILIQAHPFRKGIDVLLDLKYLDGVEANCHPLYDATHVNKLASIAKNNNLLLTCGGDFHNDTHRPKCGVYLNDDLKDTSEIVSYLKETKEIKLCIQEVKEFETYDYVFIK